MQSCVQNITTVR